MEERKLSGEEQREYEAIVDEFIKYLSEHTKGLPANLPGRLPGTGILEELKNWYVGITKDLDERLTWHRVRRTSVGEGPKDLHHFRQASSSDVAREVEAFFVEQLGAEGGLGGGENPDWVYAYKIAPHTSQEE